MLPYAIISITLALVFYSLGVWSERILGTLKRWHVGVFWCGLLFDTLGTTLMGMLAGEDFQMNFHGITGMIAILLMVFHAVWATVVMAKGSAVSKAGFHKFSLVVWLVWLIPYVSGAVFGMAR